MCVGHRVDQHILNDVRPNCVASTAAGRRRPAACPGRCGTRPASRSWSGTAARTSDRWERADTNRETAARPVAAASSVVSLSACSAACFAFQCQTPPGRRPRPRSAAADRSRPGGMLKQLHGLGPRGHAPVSCLQRRGRRWPQPRRALAGDTARADRAPPRIVHRGQHQDAWTFELADRASPARPTAASPVAHCASTVRTLACSAGAFWVGQDRHQRRHGRAAAATANRLAPGPFRRDGSWSCPIGQPLGIRRNASDRFEDVVDQLPGLGQQLLVAGQLEQFGRIELLGQVGLAAGSSWRRSPSSTNGLASAGWFRSTRVFAAAIRPAWADWLRARPHGRILGQRGSSVPLRRRAAFARLGFIGRSASAGLRPRLPQLPASSARISAAAISGHGNARPQQRQAAAIGSHIQLAVVDAWEANQIVKRANQVVNVTVGPSVADNNGLLSPHPATAAQFLSNSTTCSSTCAGPVEP